MAYARPQLETEYGGEIAVGRWQECFAENHGSYGCRPDNPWL